MVVYSNSNIQTYLLLTLKYKKNDLSSKSNQLKKILWGGIHSDKNKVSVKKDNYLFRNPNY